MALAMRATAAGAAPADQPGLLPGGASDEQAVPPPGLSQAGRTKARALALYFEGLGFARRNDAKSTIARYLEVLELDPQNLRLAKRLADVYVLAKQPNDALAVLEEMVRKNPERPEASIFLSGFCYREHNNSDAVKARAFSVAKEAVERFPGHAAVHGNLAALLLEEGEREQAAAVIERAAARREANPQFWLDLAGPAAQVWPPRDAAGRAKVLGLFEKALALAPDAPGVLEETADFLATTGSPDRAVPMYEKVIARQPDDLKAREKLARALSLAGQPAAAAKVWEKLLEIDPRSQTAHLALAQFFAKTGDRQKSVRHRAEALRWSEEEGPREAMRLAQDMIEAGLAREALSVLERAEFNAPDSPEPPYRAAGAHRVLGEFDRAVAAFERAAHLAAADEEMAREFLTEGFYYDWAMACDRAGQLERAEEMLRKAIALVPKDQPQLAAKSYNALGYLWLEHRVHLDEAGPLIERALKLDPDNPAFLDSLGWFHFQKGDYRKSIDLLRQAAKAAETPDARNR